MSKIEDVVKKAMKNRGEIRELFIGSFLATYEPEQLTPEFLRSLVLLEKFEGNVIKFWVEVRDAGSPES